MSRSNKLTFLVYLKQLYNVWDPSISKIWNMLTIVSALLLLLLGALEVVSIILAVITIFLALLLFFFWANYKLWKQKEERIAELSINISKKPCNAPPVDFSMFGCYRHVLNKQFVYAKLTTPISSNISKFNFLDTKGKAFGIFSKFQTTTSQDNEKHANYFLEDKEDSDKFLETIHGHKGKIKAQVLTTTGKKYIYTYEAQGKGWKVAVEENHPNMQDTFILIDQKPA